MGRGAARCRKCQRPVVFFRSPFTGNVRTFEPAPVDGHDPLAVAAFPVMGRTAYLVPDLVEVIQVQRQCSDVDAEAEVRDMPWHVPHDCTYGTTPSTTPSSTDTKEKPHP